MNPSKIKKALVLTIASSAFALGCELIVDFDRTKIPVEGAAEAGTDATTPDTGAPDTGTDTGATDAGTDATDAATDAADASDAADDADAT